MININNREDFFKKLYLLKFDMKPIWGQMSPQHIVEHMTFSIKISTGEKPQKCVNNEDVAAEIKAKLIYTDIELPLGIKTPVLGDTPPPLEHPNIETSMNMLKKELEKFDNYYKQNPNKQNMHPRMGLLNYKEWTILHSKHFTHHLKQFNIL